MQTPDVMAGGLAAVAVGAMFWQLILAILRSSRASIGGAIIAIFLTFLGCVCMFFAFLFGACVCEWNRH
jgi:hypothetical protein